LRAAAFGFAALRLDFLAAGLRAALFFAATFFFFFLAGAAFLPFLAFLVFDFAFLAMIVLLIVSAEGAGLQRTAPPPRRTVLRTQPIPALIAASSRAVRHAAH
jgi:hypothetical protein